MTGLPEPLTVRCPQCTIVIAGVTPETMVYCRVCRKWCREVEEVMRAAANTPPPARKPRRRIRCH